MKNIILISLLGVSFQFISKNKPNRCDVVLGNQKNGTVNKTWLQNLSKISEVKFYNKYCKHKILSYTFYYTYKSKAIEYKSLNADLPIPIKNIISKYRVNQKLMFKVECMDEESNVYFQNICLKVI